MTSKFMEIRPYDDKGRITLPKYWTRGETGYAKIDMEQDGTLTIKKVRE